MTLQSVLWTQFCLGVRGCVESVAVITGLERRVRADHQIGQNSGRDRQCPDAGGPRVLRLSKPHHEEGVQGGSPLGRWTFQGESEQAEGV